MICFPFIAGLVALLLTGCGKDAPWATSAKGGSNTSPEESSGTRPTSVQPAGAETATGEPPATGTIARGTDGLWYEESQSDPFSGKVIFTQDDTKWEEHYEAGKRTRVKAWDADGKQLKLHAWNDDGAPKD